MPTPNFLLKQLVQDTFLMIEEEFGLKIERKNRGVALFSTTTCPNERAFLEKVKEAIKTNFNVQVSIVTTLANQGPFQLVLAPNNDMGQNLTPHIPLFEIFPFPFLPLRKISDYLIDTELKRSLWNALKSPSIQKVLKLP